MPTSCGWTRASASAATCARRCARCRAASPWWIRPTARRSNPGTIASPRARPACRAGSPTTAPRTGSRKAARGEGPGGRAGRDRPPRPRVRRHSLHEERDARRDRQPQDADLREYDPRPAAVRQWHPDPGRHDALVQSRPHLSTLSDTEAAMNVEKSQITLPDGRVELLGVAGLQSSPLYNHDLAPVPIVRRTWSTYNYAALWISMAHCIPTYMLASGLMAQGMNWKQALFTILLGNTIVLFPILLNSHPGTKYGIPFPVFARAAFGTAGSNLPALMRALVACGWFGIQAWIGGEALNTFFASLLPGWRELLGAGFAGHTTTEWLSFLLFWGLNIFIIYRGMDLLRLVENWAAPFVLVMTGVLLAWAVKQAHGLGPLLAQPGRLRSAAEFLPVFVPSLTAMIGFWATLSLNMSDFTRFGRSQRQQVIGQVVALPTTMFAFASMGVLITSASVILYREVIWDPVKLVGHFHSPVVVGIAMLSVVVATLAVNIAANVVSPANDFANALPRWISFKTGGLITGLIGIAMQPWRLLADPKGYIFAWLVGYSGGLGSIAGVLIADYWVLRRRQLDLADLYLRDGRYGGWSAPAVIATLAGCALAWGGLVIPAMRPLYDYAWFVGFFSAGVIYLALARRRPAAEPAASPAN